MTLSRFLTRTVATLGVTALLAACFPTTGLAKRAPDNPARMQGHLPGVRASVMQADKRVDATSGVTLAWYNLDTPMTAARVEDAAEGFLKTHAGDFGEGTVDNLRVLKVKRSPAGRHVHLQQMYEGIPVYNATFNVSLDKRNHVTMVTANPVEGFKVATTSPSIDGLRAVQDTRDWLGASSSMMEHPVVRLMGFRTEDHSDHLAWVVNYPTEEPMGDWIVIWDATTGEWLETYDQMQWDDGTGMAFIPDPLTSAGVSYGGGYSDNSDADSPELNDERQSVTLMALTQVGANWELDGPFVDITDFEAPSSTPASSPNLDGFSFTRSEQGFEDVNVYYNIDTWQRHIQSLGFDDLQNTSIQVDPHGLSGADNSHYIPSTNRIAWGEGGVDDAEDADVVLHEYGHALHHDAASGGFNTDMASISEGFGDYDAVTYSARQSDFHNTWVFNWDGHNTYWPGRMITTTGTYPSGWGGNIYTNGSIWAHALWLMRQDPGMDPDTADAIVFQGMFFQNGNGTVLDAAQGLLQADDQLFDRHYRNIIYNALSAKGLVPPAGDLVGTVTDAVTGNPIEGAFVTLAGSSSDPAFTNADGEYAFYTVAAGDYVLIASATGFSDYSNNVTVVSGEETVVDIQMGSVGGAIDPESLSLELDVGSTLDTTFTLVNEGSQLDWIARPRPLDVTPVDPFSEFNQVSVEAMSGDDRLQGVTFFDGNLVVSGGNGTGSPNHLYVFNGVGELVSTIDQPTTSLNGFYDLTSDGSLMYGSEGDLIVGFGLDGVAVDTIAGPFNPNRALAYDPDHDWFWCADNSTGLTAIDRNGDEQAHYTYPNMIKGLGYFPYEQNGYNLVVTSVVAGGASARVSMVDPETGEIGEDVDLAGGTIIGSEVSNTLAGGEEYWLCAALIDGGETGITLDVMKVDWSVPYLNISPRRGNLGIGENAEIQLSVDGNRLVAGDHDAEIWIDFLNGGTGGSLSVSIHASAVSAPEKTVPERFALDPAYPNPFNPSTVMTLHLPDRSDVKVAVYDLLGRLVDRMNLQALGAGVHRVEWAAPAGLASGIYFVRVDAGHGQVASQKLILMK